MDEELWRRRPPHSPLSQIPRRSFAVGNTKATFPVVVLPGDNGSGSPRLPDAMDEETLRFGNFFSTSAVTSSCLALSGSANRRVLPAGNPTAWQFPLQ